MAFEPDDEENYLVNPPNLDGRINENLYHRLTTSYQAFFQVQELIGNEEFYPMYEEFFVDSMKQLSDGQNCFINFLPTEQRPFNLELVTFEHKFKEFLS